MRENQLISLILKNLEHGLLCEIDTTSFAMIKSRKCILSNWLLLTIDFDVYTEITLARSAVLTAGKTSPRGVNKFPAGRAPLCALQHGKFDINKFTKKYICF